MKKIICIFSIIYILVVLPVFSAQKNMRAGIVIATPGVTATSMVSPSGSTLNAATTLWSVAWTPQVNHTLSGFRIWVTSVVSAQAADMRITVYSDTLGNPNASLGAGYTTTCTPAATTFVTCTGLTGTITGGTTYHMVLSNANAVPGSHTFTLQYGGADAGFPNLPYNFYIQTSSNTGSTWSTDSSRFPFFRIDYSDDSSYEGTGITGMGPIDATNIVYGSHEYGSIFTMGSTAWNIIGISMYIGVHNGPTGAIKYKVYTGSGTTLTLLASTQTILNGQANGLLTAFFGSTVTLPANTVIRIVMADQSADSSSAYFQGWPVTVDSDAASKALQMFKGTLQATYCSATCLTKANWTDTSTSFVAFGVVLDPDGEFSGGGVSGGVGAR